MSSIDTNQIIPPGFSSVKEWLGFKWLVQTTVATGLVRCKNQNQGLILALYGRELGIPPIESLNVIQIIQGNISLAAETMLSMIYRKVPGAQAKYVTPPEKANIEATFEAQRPGGEVQTIRFTIKDAEQADLTRNQNWRKYPAAMLRARAISAMVRAVFPEAMAGQIYAPEETQAIGGLQSGQQSDLNKRLPGPQVDEDPAPYSSKPGRPTQEPPTRLEKQLQGTLYQMEKKKAAPKPKAKPKPKPKPVAKQPAPEPPPHVEGPADLSSYRFPSGRYMGKGLRELTTQEINGYTQQLSGLEKKSAWQLEALTAMGEWVGGRQSG